MLMLLVFKTFTENAAILALKCAKLPARFIKSWEDRQAIRQLNSFDEHMLHDIGLTRSDVAAAMDTPFFARPLDNIAKRSATNLYNDSQPSLHSLK